MSQKQGKLTLGVLNRHRSYSEVLVWDQPPYSFLLRMLGIAQHWCLLMFEIRSVLKQLFLIIILLIKQLLNCIT